MFHTFILINKTFTFNGDWEEFFVKETGPLLDQIMGPF
jgi:hypothetical protein